jgi:hypothetical protein
VQEQKRVSLALFVDGEGEVEVALAERKGESANDGGHVMSPRMIRMNGAGGVE